VESLLEGSLQDFW